MILATLCFIHRDGRTLMLHRVKRTDDIHAGKWNGLGGKFEESESPEECVTREVREESGPEIAPLPAASSAAQVGGEPAAERSDYRQVLLESRLHCTLERLNPSLPKAPILSGSRESCSRNHRGKPL